MPSTATITSFFEFSTGTVIRSAQHNTNFSNFRGHLVPIATDTAASSNLTHDLGAPTHMWRGNYFQYGVMYQNTAGSIPSNPTTGSMALYFQNDGLLYNKHPGGTTGSFHNTLSYLAKGDLFVATGTGTGSRLPLGSDGQVLTADAATTTGMKWASAAAGSVTNWTTVTLTGSWTNNTTYTAMRRTVGDTREYWVHVALAGGGPNSAALTINLGSGDVIDTSKMPGVLANSTPLGHTGRARDAGTQSYEIYPIYVTTTAIGVYTISVSDPAYLIRGAQVTQAVPFTWDDGDDMIIKFSVPIA